MAAPFDHIPEEIKRAAAEDAAVESSGRTKTMERPPEDKPPTGGERKQKRLIKYRRANVVLTEDEVQEIKAGRKKLRREMKQQHIYSKKEFELTASSLGLYFDKNKHPFLFWLWRHWLGALLGALAAFLAVMLVFAGVQRMRGHFTINLTDDMFREGFTLSETVGFENPTTYLFANPAQDVPCVSISQLPLNLDEIDGEHNDLYFAYTFYLRNEGESTVGYNWSMNITRETQKLSSAAWAMVFEDGQMRFYAKAAADGRSEALPALGDDTKGYPNLRIRELAAGSDQFREIKTVGQITYWRVIPDAFETDTRITSGKQENVAPDEVHKYTVVLWLEGDDPEATDEMIGGHLGVEMDFRLMSEPDDKDTHDGIFEGWKGLWQALFSSDQA